MKKRILALLLACIMIFGISACGGGGDKAAPSESPAQSDGEPGTDAGEPSDEAKSESPAEGYEIALITDVGTIDDKSFNQGSWEGVEAYAKDNNKTYKYYKPLEKSDEAYITSIELAIKGGAKLIVCPGFLFEVPIYKMQTKYPDVTFIIIDGAPQDGEGNYYIKQNTLGIFYAEEQAGYLAGYAAVTEGYKNLGFMGGIAVPAVVRFGYGFVQGADKAAKELGIPKDEVKIKYTYVGNFDATPENMAKAASWYNEGTEVIFACGGAVGNSVMKAAETAGKKVIGVDVDQSSESDTVITSAAKNLKKSVYDAISSYYFDVFMGGTSLQLNAAVDGIELPMETSRFNVFTQEMYDNLYKQLAEGEGIEIKRDTDVEDASQLPNELVSVEVIK